MYVRVTAASVSVTDERSKVGNRSSGLEIFGLGQSDHSYVQCGVVNLSKKAPNVSISQETYNWPSVRQSPKGSQSIYSGPNGSTVRVFT
jgi:hypothetical protein